MVSKEPGLTINDSSNGLTMEQYTWLEAETRLIYLSCGSDLVYPVHEIYQKKYEANTRSSIQLDFRYCILNNGKRLRSTLLRRVNLFCIHHQSNLDRSHICINSNFEIQ